MPPISNPLTAISSSQVCELDVGAMRLDKDTLKAFDAQLRERRSDMIDFFTLNSYQGDYDLQEQGHPLTP